jgi:ribosomal protein S12 methylthiotransferase accessory factor YcaO
MAHLSVWPCCKNWSSSSISSRMLLPGEPDYPNVVAALAAARADILTVGFGAHFNEA